MATGNSSTLSSIWYCHSCQKHVTPNLIDYCCSVCESGCIEEIKNSTSEANAVPQRSSGTHSVHSTANPPNIFHHPMVPPFASFFGQDVGVGPSMFPPPGGPPPEALDETIRALNSLQIDSFQAFMGQFVQGLLGNGAAFSENLVNVQVQPLLAGNTGDYVWTQGGLDNVVTMLMNQLDGSGPPPAERNLIESLPNVTVDQQLVDACTQCHVCMEDFVLDEEVRRLPCRHLYHTDCIVPWLEMHGTCPICRKSVASQPLSTQSPSSSSSSSSTASSSTQSSSTSNSNDTQQNS